MKEKTPVYTYKVPEEFVPHIGEPKAICVEMIDELLNKAFGIHILEPVVTFKEETKVKPTFQKSIKKREKAEGVRIIEETEKRAKDTASRQTNRSNLPKIGSELSSKQEEDKPKEEAKPKVEDGSKEKEKPKEEEPAGSKGANRTSGGRKKTVG